MFDPYSLSSIPIGSEFTRIAAGDQQGDVLRAALECAMDFFPNLNLGETLANFDQKCATLARLTQHISEPRQRLASMVQHFFVQEAYRGNHVDYFNPENNYINRVLVHRRGSPVALSIIFASMAERLGVCLNGVSLPFHFLLSFGSGTGTVFIDCFNQGHFLDRRSCLDLVASITSRKSLISEEYLIPQGKEAYLLRLLKNLKRYFLRQGDYHSAILVLRRLAMIESKELKSLGLTCFDARRTTAGIQALELYLEKCKDQSEGFYLTSVIDRAFKRIYLFN